jgi:HK97 family phage portal protein
MVTRLLTRAPRNDTPVPYVGRSGGLGFFGGGGGGKKQQMDAYGAVGTLFAIVHRLASATAQVDWKLYRKRTDGRRTYGPASDDRVEVTRHLALQVWNKPNPFYTRQEFVESFQQHVDLTGESEWIVQKNGTPWPAELWIARPDLMSPVPDKEKYLLGWIYNSPDGDKIPFDNDEVIQIRMPNPNDPYRGMGPVQTILVDLDSTTAAAAWNRNFFRNSAMPGGVIEVPESWDDRQWATFKARWAEQHRGVSNAHRPGLLEGGAKWANVSYSMQDMQFVELRNVSREVVREAFTFPKPMLGTVEDVNRANAEAAEVVFARWLLIERLERIKQALNNDFLPLFGAAAENVEFDYDNPVPEDLDRIASERTSKANAAKVLRDAGWNPDEVLETVGLPPMTYVGGVKSADQPPAPGDSKPVQE